LFDFYSCSTLFLFDLVLLTFAVSVSNVFLYGKNTVRTININQAKDMSIFECQNFDSDSNSPLPAKPSTPSTPIFEFRFRVCNRVAESKQNQYDFDSQLLVLIFVRFRLAIFSHAKTSTLDSRLLANLSLLLSRHQLCNPGFKLKLLKPSTRINQLLILR